MGSFVIFLILFAAIFLTFELKSTESTRFWVRVAYMLIAFFASFIITSGLRIIGIGL